MYGAVQTPHLYDTRLHEPCAYPHTRTHTNEKYTARNLRVRCIPRASPADVP